MKLHQIIPENPKTDGIRDGPVHFQPLSPSSRPHRKCKTTSTCTRRCYRVRWMRSCGPCAGVCWLPVVSDKLLSWATCSMGILGIKNIPGFPAPDALNYWCGEPESIAALVSFPLRVAGVMPPTSVLLALPEPRRPRRPVGARNV